MYHVSILLFFLEIVLRNIYSYMFCMAARYQYVLLYTVMRVITTNLTGDVSLNKFI